MLEYRRDSPFKHRERRNSSGTLTLEVASSTGTAYIYFASSHYIFQFVMTVAVTNLLTESENIFHFHCFKM